MTRTAYLRGLKTGAHATLSGTAKTHIRQTVYAVSRAKAAAQARADEAARLAAQERAAAQARLEIIRANGRAGMNRTRILRRDFRRDAAKQLSILRLTLRRLQATPSPTAAPDATPGIVFRPTQP